MSLEQIFTNGYFYFNIAAVLIILVFLVALTAKTQFSATVGWLRLFTVAVLIVGLWSIGLFFTDTPFKYDIVASLQILYVVLIGVSLVGFSVSLIGDAKWMAKPVAMIFVWLPALIALYLGWHTDLIFTTDYNTVSLKDWGYVPSGHGKLQWLLIYWIGSSVATSVYRVLRYYRTIRNKIFRIQTRMIMIGIVVPFLVGMVGAGILPLFDIQIPATTTLATVLLCGFLGYAVIRYGSGLDPSLIVSNVVSVMGNPAIAYDINGQIIFANQAANDLFSYRETTLLNRSVIDLISSDHVSNFKQRLKSHKDSNNDTTVFESVISSREGKSIAVNIYSSVFRDKSKRTIGTVMVMTDIQRLQELLNNAEQLSHELRKEKEGVEQKVIERTKELHEEQAKLRASIEGLELGFILIDTKNKILIQNKATESILGLKEQMESIEDLNKSLSTFDLLANCQKAQKSKQPIDIKEVTFGAKILHFFLAPVTVTDQDNQSKDIGTVILIEDITEAKVMERSKDEFFSIASHELRTPLTSIKGNTSMIMEFYQDAIKDKQLSEMVSDIHESSVRLIGIVNDFLDVSRLEQGRMSYNYEAFSLEEIVEQVMYEMKPILQGKKLYLKFDKMTLNSLPKIWSDKNRLKQVVYNLIGNATKFTEAGGITVNAEVDGKFIKVFVADTGRGISMDSQKLLFHKFQQASSSLLTRDTTRGTGLGLYISKMMIENMGGVLALERSEEDKGTTFSFTVAIADKQSGVQKSKSESSLDVATGLEPSYISNVKKHKKRDHV